jgi:hypothetical protein
MSLSYQLLINYLQHQHDYPISLKSNYCVIIIPGTDYHITIYQDQWDRYEEVSRKPYHLFHISLNAEIGRCSSYFWVNKYSYRVKKIPRNYFLYNQPSYSFFSSTRSPCHLRNIIGLLKIFQKILNGIEIKNPK